jgi:hypothetical protein
MQKIRQRWRRKTRAARKKGERMFLENSSAGAKSAVFLCAFAALREISSPAKTQRRKGKQRKAEDFFT